MKRKILTVLLSSLLILILAFTLVGCNKNRETGEISPFYSKWMECIDDNALIKNIAMPGSHDAGTVDIGSLGETQSSRISKQLSYGVRYFDIRVEKKGDKLVIFHSILSGMAFDEVVADIKSFMQTNTTELLILDFQHFKNDSMQDVINVLENQLDTEKYAVKNNTNSSDLDFIDNLKLKDCRGKFIITWGSDTGVKDKNYLFRRNNDDGDLSACCLESYYKGNLHKESSSKFIEEALPSYYKSYKSKNKGLFVLQRQITAPNLFTTLRSLEDKHNANMTAFVKNIKNKPEWLALTNIVMRDYVTDDISKSKATIELNEAKKIIAEEKEEIFKEGLNG